MRNSCKKCECIIYEITLIEFAEFVSIVVLVWFAEIQCAKPLFQQSNQQLIRQILLQVLFHLITVIIIQQQSIIKLNLISFMKFQQILV